VLLTMASVEERRVRSTMYLTTPELLVRPRDHCIYFVNDNTIQSIY
jgi:hypothetical protein